MSEYGVMSRLLAFVHALLPEDWFGSAGKAFSQTTGAISDFAEEHHVRPGDIAHEGIELARTALHGKASKDLAAAVKDFADAEHTRIETELQRRSLECRVRKEEAEATLAELQVLHAEADLLKKLKKLGVVISKDTSGLLTVLPAPPTVDLDQLAESRLRDAVTYTERVILAAILLDNAAFQQVAGFLTPPDFSTQSHQLIFESMVELSTSGRDIDFINLAEILEARGQIEAVGGIKYFTGLIDGVPRLKTIQKHVEFILKVRPRSTKFDGAGSDVSNSGDNE